MPGDDLSGAVLDDRYEVFERIAEGAMGAVYRGERVKLGRAVAIKIMHDALPDELASRQRFEREAKLMARLEHPHCVSVIDFGLHDGKPYLVMELVRGTSLMEELARITRFPPARAAELVRQILSGLGHAHELGIVHRDIKPANIMITERTGLGEQVRILDFGLARPAMDSTKLTTGIVVGTPNYMAPEQIKGGAIDGRTDLYAVGVLLFELLTGTKPFLADDPLAVVRKHLHQAPPALADLAPGIPFGELEDVVGRALMKAPQQRYASAAEMSAALDHAVGRRASTSEIMARSVPVRTADASSAKVATESGWTVAPEVSPSQVVEQRPHTAITPTVSGSVQTTPESNTGPVQTSTAAPASSGPNAPRSNELFPTSNPNAVPQTNHAGPNPAPTGRSNELFPTAAPSGTSATPQSNPPSGPTQTTPASDKLFLTNDSAAQTNIALDTVSGGVPTPMDIPPTRQHAAPPSHQRTLNPNVPSTRMLPIPGIAITRTHLLIGGGVLALVIVAIVAAKSGSSPKPPAPVVTTAKISVDATPTDPVAPSLARAADLYANGDLEPALDVVTKARRQHPESAQLAFLDGKIYFAKLWWSDGVKAFRDAIRLDNAYRTDPELLKIVLRGFITTPEIDSRIEDFLRDDLGSAIKPALADTAKNHPNAQIRSRAATELKRLENTR